MCNFRLAQLMMRKHDIFLCQNHIPEHFEMQHVFRDSVTKSFTVGEQKEHSNKTTRIIQDGIVDSIQESEKTCPIDQTETSANDDQDINLNECDMFNGTNIDVDDVDCIDDNDNNNGHNDVNLKSAHNNYCQ